MRRLALMLPFLLAGCTPSLYVPEQATRPYPIELHDTRTVDIEVFRHDTLLEIVNATPRSYSGVDIWLNQRYVRHVESIPAGATVRLSLWDFIDERGERLNAGGFFRTRRADPVRLVQIQTGPDEPMIGLRNILDDKELD